MTSNTPRIDRLEPNMVANGAMEVAQTGQNLTLDGFDGVPRLEYAVDLFGYQSAQGNTLDFSQTTNNPSTQSVHSLRATRSLAGLATNVIANDRLSYLFEGHDLVGKIGQTFTVFFRVRSNQIGPRHMSFYNPASGRSLVRSYNIDAANAFELKSISFVVENTTWNLNSDVGMAMRWAMRTGSNNQTGTLDSWQAGNFFAGPTQTQSFDNTGDFFELGEVMVLPGNLEGVTDIPFRRAENSFAAEVGVCQRRFEKSSNLDLPPNNDTGRFLDVARPDGDVFKSINFRETKRVTPTIALLAGTTAGITIGSNPGQGGFSIFGSLTTSASFAVQWQADANFTTDS